MAAYGGFTNLQDTAGELAPVQPSEYYTRQWLDRLRRLIPTIELATREDFPQRSGATVKWPVMDPLAVVTAATAQGDDPVGQSVVVTAQTGVLLKFAGSIELSEEVDLQTINGTTEQFNGSLSQQGAESIEGLILTELATSSTTQNAGTALSATDLAVAFQGSLEALVTTHRMTPGYFPVICSPESAVDMSNEGAPTWTDARAKAFNAALQTPFRDTPETAAVHNCFIKISNLVQRDTGASPDDDQNILIPDNSFGVSMLDSSVKPEVKIVPTGQPDRGSPTGAWGTMAWRIYFVAVEFRNRTRVILSDATGIGV